MAFQVIPEYPEYPRSAGTCFTCHAPKRPDDILIDLGVLTDKIEDADGNIHGFTVPVICSTCIVELAGLVGCLDILASNKIRSERDQAITAAKDAKADLNALKELVQAATA